MAPIIRSNSSSELDTARHLSRLELSCRRDNNGNLPSLNMPMIHELCAIINDRLMIDDLSGRPPEFVWAQSSSGHTMARRFDLMRSVAIRGIE